MGATLKSHPAAVASIDLLRPVFDSEVGIQIMIEIFTSPRNRLGKCH